MKVSLVSMSSGIGPLEGKGPQEIIAYAARVSNPSNQMSFETAPKLLAYCLKHGHFSVFETASLTFEIKTSRAIAAQILRHRSFTFQEFSQRYSSPTEFELYLPRRQDKKNKQNSIDDMDQATHEWFIQAQQEVNALAFTKYNDAVEKGIAKEQARFLLSLATLTTLYMTGNVRNWIHYIQTRATPDTQLEHREIAQEIKNIFCATLPDVGKALSWV